MILGLTGGHTSGAGVGDGDGLGALEVEATGDAEGDGLGEGLGDGLGEGEGLGVGFVGVIGFPTHIATSASYLMVARFWRLMKSLRAEISA
jgi:hypothetical protein